MTDPHARIALLPCPFCGGTVIEEAMRTGVVYCEQCEGQAQNKPSWNRRTALASAPAPAHTDVVARLPKPSHSGHLPEPAAGDIRSCLGRDATPSELSGIFEKGLRAILREQLEHRAKDWVREFFQSRGKYTPPSAHGLDAFLRCPTIIPESVVAEEETVHTITWELHCSPWEVNQHLLFNGEPDDCLRVSGRIGTTYCHFIVTRYGYVREDHRL